VADFTKAQRELLDWTLLDDIGTDNPFATTGEETLTAGSIENVLHIVVAHRDANDAASAYVTVVVSVQSGPSDNDEDWREHVSFRTGGGQATAETLNANSGVSQANPERLEVADTTDWDTGLGETLFLLDSGTLLDSCLCKIAGWSDNDYYINAWDLERDYDNADILYDTVKEHAIQLPGGTEKCRVDFFNSDGDATYAVRVDVTEVTDIE